jgi:hypothetical protein
VKTKKTNGEKAPNVLSLREGGNVELDTKQKLHCQEVISRHFSDTKLYGPQYSFGLNGEERVQDLASYFIKRHFSFYSNVVRLTESWSIIWEKMYFIGLYTHLFNY